MDRLRRNSRRAGKSWFEDAVYSLSQESSTDDLGAAIHALAAREGFENLVLTTLEGGALTGIDWMRLPHGFADAYMVNGWAADDPVLRHLKQAASPIGWDDLMAGRPHGPKALEMMAAAAAHEVRGGYTIPLHRPDGSCTLISMSRRTARDRPDPERSQLLTMLAIYSLTRYGELDRAEAHFTRINRMFGADPPLLVEFAAAGVRPFSLTLAHVRELVRIDVAARRWQMGLTELGTRIYRGRTHGLIADLERWGLVVEIADDDRWCFHLAPSVLGSAYLRRDAQVKQLRRGVWNTDVDRHEVPDPTDTR